MSIEKKAKLYIELEEQIKKTNNHFEKVMIQENLIVVKIISILIFANLVNFYSYKIAKKSIKTELNFKHVFIDEELPFFIDKSFVKNTLGKWPALLRTIGFNHLEDESVLQELELYIKLRNNLTHSILTKFKNKKDLENGAKKTKECGDKLLEMLNKLSKIIFETEKNLATAYYKM